MKSTANGKPDLLSSEVRSALAAARTESEHSAVVARWSCVTLAEAVEQTGHRVERLRYHVSSDSGVTITVVCDGTCEGGFAVLVRFHQPDSASGAAPRPPPPPAGSFVATHLVTVTRAKRGVCCQGLDSLAASLVCRMPADCRADAGRMVAETVPLIFRTADALRSQFARRPASRRAKSAPSDVVPAHRDAQLSLWSMKLEKEIVPCGRLDAFDEDALRAAMERVTPRNLLDADAVAAKRRRSPAKVDEAVHRLLRNALIRLLACLGIEAAGEVTLVVGGHGRRMDVVFDVAGHLMMVDVANTKYPDDTAAKKHCLYDFGSCDGRTGTFFAVTGNAADLAHDLDVFCSHLANALAPSAAAYRSLKGLLVAQLERLFRECAELKESPDAVVDALLELPWFDAPGDASFSVSVELDDEARCWIGEGFARVLLERLPAPRDEQPVPASESSDTSESDEPRAAGMAAKPPRYPRRR